MEEQREYLQEVGQLTLGGSRRENYKQNLERELESYEERAKDIKEMLKLLEKNPDLERALNLMRRIGR